MKREEFEAELRRSNFEFDSGVTPPGYHAAEHAHDRDARGLIMCGQLGITIAGIERIYNSGETFSLPAGLSHSERAVGSEDIHFVFGYLRET